ncbi:MAG TPA: hypothetical protein VGL46_14945 [Pseudonocardiaceae bacterium]
MDALDAGAVGVAGRSPAIDLILDSAGDVISRALAAERSARPPGSRVQHTGGCVRLPDRRHAGPGPPVGYLVSLDHLDLVPARYERIVADALASEPWGIMVLDEKEPPPAGAGYRLTPDDAAARLTEVTAPVEKLEQVHDDAAQLAAMTARGADPGSQAVHDRLVASVGGGGRLSEARALRDEVAAALQTYSARTGRAVD